MKHFIAILGISLFLQACLVSRTSRPKLTGYVFDMDSKIPIAGCAVGESFTDSTGYYELKEKRYREFTWVGKEAPPLRVEELVVIDGYTTDTIKGWNPFGGGLRKGAHWEMERV